MKKKLQKTFRTGFFLSVLLVITLACDPSNNGSTITDDPDDIKITSISLGNDFELTEGGEVTIIPQVLPSDASNKSLNWSSDDNAVATVNQNGLVTAVSVGEAVITAAAMDGSGVSGSVKVTVTEEEIDPPPSGELMTPQEIFASLKGQSITTNGWADRANDGAGLSYANPASLTLIDDTIYPTAEAKYNAFIQANIPSPNINSAQGTISGTVSDAHKFIILSGDIDLSNGRISDSDKTFYDQFNANNDRVNGDIVLNLGSNTTIIGIDNARIKFGGIRINNKSNVIIRNVTFYDAHGSTEKDTASSGNSASKASIDALVVQGTSNGVWVDHCKFTDGTCNDMIRNYNHDGSFDIPAGKNITVSWCEFTNHDKVMLVAGSDSLTEVTDRQITLHHNYFHAATQRMPRTRGTQMHVYNNYYDNIGVSGNSGYCMGPGMNAHFIVENNFFGSFYSSSNTKIVDYYDNATYPAIVWSAGNNKTVARSTNDTGNSKPWEPAYVYTLEPNNGLPASIPAGAGPVLEFRK